MMIKKQQYRQVLSSILNDNFYKLIFRVQIMTKIYRNDRDKF